jgi:hypothetical protein
MEKQVITTSLAVNPPQRMAMNQHYSKLDYDYVPTPIDYNAPLVEYCPPVYDRDFWDETLTPERPPVVVPQLMNITTRAPLRNAALFKYTHDDRPQSTQIMSHKTIILAKKAIKDLILTNVHLKKYVHLVNDYDTLFNTLTADSEFIAQEITACNNRMFRANLLMSKCLFRSICPF